MRTSSRGCVTMMIIVAIIILCITIGMFYSSEKRKTGKGTNDGNGTFLMIKRERVLNITDQNSPLEKIISKKGHCNGTVETIETWNDDKDKDMKRR